MTAGALSKWESSGQLPDEQRTKVLTLLETDLLGVRRAAIEELGGKLVRGRDSVELWHDAIALSDRDWPVKFMLGVLPIFYDDGERFVQFRPRDIQKATGLDEDVVNANWEKLLNSGFIQRVGQTEDLYELKFPG